MSQPEFDPAPVAPPARAPGPGWPAPGVPEPRVKPGLPEAAAALVAALNQRHQAMAALGVSGAGSPPEERARLVDDIAAAGAVVPPGAERDTLRNLLFFWAGDQSSRGERPRDAPPPTLASFVEGPTEVSPGFPRLGPLAPAAIAPPSAAGASPDAAEPSPVNRAGRPGPVADAGPRPNPGGWRKTRPVPPPIAPASTDAPTDAEARTIVRIAALARQWRQTDDINKKGYLLTGKALVEASLFIDNDPDIAALVAASETEEKATQRRRVWARRFLFIACIIAVIGALTAAYLATADAKRTEEIAKLRASYDAVEIEALRQANTERGGERDQIRQTAQAAVEALQRNDLAPLRSLLQNLGSADPNDLTRLELRSASPLERAYDATFARAQQSTAPRQPSPPTAGDTCSGYLWFGAAGDSSRLDNHGDPGALKAGDTVTLDQRNDIRLRSDWPSDAYAMGRQIGVVPSGSHVTLSSAPRRFHRGNADQIWAQVSVPRAFCTTVFLQYVGTADKTGAVLNALRGLDVQAPPADQVASAKGLAEVRYFWPEDKPVADQVAAGLAAFNGGTKLNVVDLKAFPTKPSSGTIEVWLDLKG